MKSGLLFLVALLSFGGIGRVKAEMKEAQFNFTNELSKPVEIKLLDSRGKVLDTLSLKPAKEVHVGAVRRVVIQVDGNDREYSLPVVPYVKSAKRTSDVQYVGMLGGKWLLRITASENLEIECLEGGDVGEAVDLTATPLGFPRAPRKSDETFNQYKARLDLIERAALRGAPKQREAAGP